MSSSSREEDFLINSAVLLIKMIYLSFKGDSCIYLDRRKGRIAEKKIINVCRYLEKHSLPGDLLLSSGIQRSMKLASRYLS